MSDTVRKSPSRVPSRTFRLALSMTADNFRDLYEIAVSAGCSVSQLASKALEEWVAEQKKLNHS